MSIDFNRNGAQLYYESLIGVTDPLELPSHATDFKNHILSGIEAQNLKNVLRNDSNKFFFNGLECFIEGVNGAIDGNYSWATVKLYYSIFYLIRSSLAIKGYAIVRSDKSMFRLLAKDGEKPVKPSGKKYSSTHEGTISHYRDIFSSSDILLANAIDGKDTYEWMKDVREIVNYRSDIFSEPRALNVWDDYIEVISNNQLDSVLKKIYDDTLGVKCFQEEYAILAIPLVRLRETYEDITLAGLKISFDNERRDFLVGKNRCLEFLPHDMFGIER